MKEKNKTKESPILTADEVAERLKVTKEWVVDKAKSGQLPGRKIGDMWRFHRDAIDMFFLTPVNQSEQVKSNKTKGK